MRLCPHKDFSSATFAEMAKSKLLDKAKEIVSPSDGTTSSGEEQETLSVSSKKKNNLLYGKNLTKTIWIVLLYFHRVKEN